MKKLCIFDLDGTILDTIEDIAHAFNNALVKNGLPTHDISKYCEMLGDGIIKLSIRATGLTPDDDKFKTIVDYFFYFYSKCNSKYTKCYDGIPELLDNLQNNSVKIAVLSNKPDTFVKTLVAKYLKNINFSYIQGGLESIPLKPDPTSVNNIISKLKVSKNETLFIGDSIVDVETAKRAFVSCIAVTWGFQPKESLINANPDYIVDNPIDILNYI
ncbi:MAG: HAD family hydrolase [Oscillospiraceae bacterium]|nr:HAD family hydrolase [Oscillospiraceae bacterium]